MRKLDIAITKAQLVSFDVKVKDNKPQVSATLSLLTSGGKPITSYTIDTDSWSATDKFDLPLSAIQPIVDLARILEQVAVKHCRDGQKALTNGKNPPKQKAKVSQTVVIEDISDEPINLDDIPF